MNSTPSIAIIGAGHMATYMLSGLARTGFDFSQVCITDNSAEKLKTIAEKFSVKTTEDNQAAIRAAQIVILAIKPQNLTEFMQQCADAFLHQPLVISILASTSIAHLKAAIGYDKIIRAMPNVLVNLSEGNIILFAQENVADSLRKNAEYFFAPQGMIQWVDAEQQLDAYTILTGCGPGYVFYLMQCVIDAAKALNITEEEAKKSVLQLFSGAAQMAMISDHSLTTLQQQVASKGGLTEKLLASLASDKIDHLLKKAFVDAYEHGQTLHHSKENK